MYQLIIIDDEQIVREGIRTLLPWEGLGFCIVDEAADGEEGYELIMKHRPDLVLVDVRMPGMTGIELIAETKKAGFKGKYVILSGYSEFEYAKTAISYGVKGYLLKPIDEGELNKYVNDIKKELDEEKKEKDYFNHNNSADLEKVRQNVVYNLLMNQNISLAQNDIVTYHLDFNYQLFHVIVLSNDKFYLDNDYSERIRLAIKGLLHYEYLVLSDKIVLILKGNNHKDMVDRLMKNNKCIKERFHEGFFITLGQRVSNLKDIHFSYECAKYLSELRFIFGSTDHISIENIIQKEKSEYEDDFDELCDAIEIGEFSIIETNIHNLCKRCRNELMKESSIKVKIVNHMLLVTQRLESKYTDDADKLISITDFTKHVNHTQTLEELEQLNIKAYIQISNVLSNSGTEFVIKRMYSFMQKNSDKDLKLETLAKLLGYNSAYLGTLFKKEMGESFNNMLDHLRISHAIKLLQSTDLKIYQVSEKVGYKNIDYFCSKFKKYNGITPKEFKREQRI